MAMARFAIVISIFSLRGLSFISPHPAILLLGTTAHAVSFEISQFPRTARSSEQKYRIEENEECPSAGDRFEERWIEMKTCYMEKKKKVGGGGG